MTHQQTTDANRRNARRMRQVMTEAEFRLWYRLRMRGLAGLRFRRLVPLGAYIVDFACLDRRLIVEVDGDLHGSDAAIEADLDRTRWLEGQGFRVARFSNREIKQNIEGVCVAITEAAGIAL